MKKIIPIAGPSITKKEIDYVYDAIKNGWYENAFDYIEKFEKKFKKYVTQRLTASKDHGPWTKDQGPWTKDRPRTKDQGPRISRIKDQGSRITNLVLARMSILE